LGYQLVAVYSNIPIDSLIDVRTSRRSGRQRLARLLNGRRGLEELRRFRSASRIRSTAGNMPETQEVSLVDKENCEAMRREEWEVLEVGRSHIYHGYGLKHRKSIFPDFLSNDPCPARARIELEIPVELTEGLSRKVVVMPSDETAHQDPSHADRNPQLSLSLTTLPPVTLSLTLPLDYPLRRPPVISRLHAAYGWLPAEKLQTLEKALLSVWEAEREQSNGEGRAILYDWVEMVRLAEPCLGTLGMMTGGELLSVLLLDFGHAGSHPHRIKHATPTLLAERLTSFDSKTRLERFSQTNYACGVCLSSIKGAKCISLACGHVFCRACLVDFWGLCISEGDVDRVGCPDLECVKQGTKAPEDDVRRVMNSEEVTRWKWLKEKKELEKGMKPIYMCILALTSASAQTQPSFTARWVSANIR